MFDSMYSIKQMSDWDLLAKALAVELTPGAVIALSGPLGAGKTTFTQALARALGAKGDPRSPTFSLLRTYRLEHESLKRLVHVDAYRLETKSDLLALDLDEERAEPGTILVIEWPEQAMPWLEHIKSVYWLSLKPLANEEREVRIERK
jgi:tRNA threonylcarbamoyladenosine biosynthesis protein TsaE